MMRHSRRAAGAPRGRAAQARPARSPGGPSTVGFAAAADELAVQGMMGPRRCEDPPTQGFAHPLGPRDAPECQPTGTLAAVCPPCRTAAGRWPRCGRRRHRRTQVRLGAVGVTPPFGTAPTGRRAGDRVTPPASSPKDDRGVSHRSWDVPPGPACIAPVRHRSADRGNCLTTIVEPERLPQCRRRAPASRGHSLPQPANSGSRSGPQITPPERGVRREFSTLATFAPSGACRTSVPALFPLGGSGRRSTNMSGTHRTVDPRASATDGVIEAPAWTSLRVHSRTSPASPRVRHGVFPHLRERARGDANREIVIGPGRRRRPRGQSRGAAEAPGAGDGVVPAWGCASRWTRHPACVRRAGSEGWTPPSPCVTRGCRGSTVLVWRCSTQAEPRRCAWCPSASCY
jgi:hypothetical protein